MARKKIKKNITQAIPIRSEVGIVQTVPICIDVETAQETPRSFGGIGPKRLSVILLVILAVGIYSSWHYYGKYQEVKPNPALEAQTEAAALVSDLGKLMELPQGETPTIATVSDKSKLSGQPFFKNALNGDKLFAYNTAMLAILYRPAINKIINVAPISTNQPQNAVQATPALSLRIAYYNGTGITGLAREIEKAVRGAYPNSPTVVLTDASKTDYKETIVVDLTGQHSQEVTEVAKLLNGKVAPMPAGEVRPEADILIISGK